MYGKHLSQTNAVSASSVALDPACLQHLITLNSLETQEGVPALLQIADEIFPEGLGRMKVAPKVAAASARSMTPQATLDAGRCRSDN